MINIAKQDTQKMKYFELFDVPRFVESNRQKSGHNAIIKVYMKSDHTRTVFRKQYFEIKTRLDKMKIFWTHYDLFSFHGQSTWKKNINGRRNR